MTREEFIMLAAAHQKALRRFLTGACCGDIALADDIAQEALLKAYISIDTLADYNKFKPWLYRIAVNIFINQYRKRLYTVDYSEATTTFSTDTPDKSFRYEALYRALDAISEKERSTILLYYMEGYATKEIAEITGASEAAVKQQLSRGRKHLRELLD